MNVCLRKVKGKSVTVSNALNNDCIDEMIKHDAGYRMLANIPTSPAYWEKIKKDSFAALRQLGKPTIFMTLSPGEKRWPELLQVLYKFHYHQDITVEEAMRLSDEIKTKLVRNDPVLCAQYFKFKSDKFINLLQKLHSIFDEFELIDYYIRVEFQKRGAPHIHVMIWLKNAPTLDPNDLIESERQIIAFIDRFITCMNDKSNPYVSYQCHIHTHTCQKKVRKEKKCRFGIPLPMMPETKIFYPLEPHEREKINQRFIEGKEYYKAIQKFMEDLYKNPREISFVDALNELNMTEDCYYYAIRTTLKSARIFLKRGSMDVGVNAYNPDILKLWEANIDVQFILDEFAVAAYMLNYINKIDAGLSKLLRQAVSDADAGNLSLRQRFQKISNIFVNGTILSAQEAVYLNLSMPLSKFSRDVVFINTGPIDSRVHMMKSKNELEKLKEANPNDENVTVPDVFAKYAAREDMENVCLADFVAEKREHKEKNGKITYTDRDTPRIIRYVRYSINKDKANFFREQCLLFLPWRNEKKDIELQNCAQLYYTNKIIIEQNRQKYVTISDERIDEVVNEMKMNDELDADSDEDDEETNDLREFVRELGNELDVDIAAQAGETTKNEKGKQNETNRYFSPQRVTEVDLINLLLPLNSQQRTFVMHILKHIRTKPNEPFYYFLSGAAGVGKSTVINALYQLITKHFDDLRAAQPDKLKVLLTAPSGKAAHLIHGTTLHTAFSLPVNQYGGQLAPLSSDLANAVRVQLREVKLVIMDECSMIGTKIFHQCHHRLVQIFGKNEPFGGASIIVVGDMNQLSPVGDQKIFVPMRNINNTEIGALFGPISPLWEHFEYFELTQIMRQKDEAQFIVALNNLAAGKMTPEDIAFIKSRQTQEDLVPLEAIRLFRSNADVDNFNEMAIQKAWGETIKCEAIDRIDGKPNIHVKQRTLLALKNRKRSETFGLAHNIDLKIGIRYMITTNIDIEDGIVNGACGVLKYIQFEENQPNKPKTLFMDFSSDRVGSKARREYKHNLGDIVHESWVPIQRTAREISMSKGAKFQVFRIQFPIMAAEALTIHKSQGSTCNCVCVNVEKTLNRELLYVALSRVTKINDMFIIGTFTAPPAPRKNDPTVVEMKRLKSERPLSLNFNTLDAKTGLVVAYHNVVSFPKYHQHIANDQWYSKCDVLILSETHTTSKFQPHLPNFELKFRSDDFDTPQKRGIFVFAKPDINIQNIFHKIEESDSKASAKFHSDIIVLKINDIAIITGYKSPRTSNAIFETQLKDAFSSLDSSLIQRVLIGDFNFNMNQTPNFLSNVMPQFNMSSKLASTDETTKYNTQIDVVFANFDHIMAGTYESYFSDHKPIYFMLTDPQKSRPMKPVTQPVNKPIKSNEPIKMKNLVIKLDRVKLPSVTTDLSVRQPVRKVQEVPNTSKSNDDNVIVIPDSSQTPASKVQEVPNTSKSNDDNVIVIPVSTKTPEQLARERAMTIEEQRIENCNYIRRRHSYLQDRHIDAFINVVNSTGNWSMLSILYVQRISMYYQDFAVVDDVQIIFEGAAGISNVGHYICVHFVYAEQTVYIYDSLYYCNISPRCRSILRGRYGQNIRIVYIKPQTRQPDLRACGVFAAAYATTIVLGLDPRTYSLRLGNSRNPANRDMTTDLRYHLADIIENNQLSPFPSQ
ncbi:uncharacterized protein LOC116344956 [Contarinia nasturtii]|uniref:uncharacterized protein LOC116344956 n=1 Tax=Contarinia nasturtii TaxID=265458 RepID=UPI0012D3965D|nr:uncharacterized protein LOC116344956 [Contarinia nasturtii]